MKRSKFVFRKEGYLVLAYSLPIEQGPIRPPSEAESLLLRLTRNCPWNKCYFCPVYKGHKYSRRTVEEILQEIETLGEQWRRVKEISLQEGYGGHLSHPVLLYLQQKEPGLLAMGIWLYRGGKQVFLQDADSMGLPAAELEQVLQAVKKNLPTVERITTYARSRTVARRKVEELHSLKKAGLTRVHIGLESGYDPLLEFMRKGATAKEHVEAGQKVKEAGLSLCEYVLLGLGGEKWSREHALHTADVINRINPQFLRMRTLGIAPRTPLYQLWQEGSFTPLDDDGVVEEERLFIEELKDISTQIVSDHILNLLEEVKGTFPQDKEIILSVIDNYLSLSSQEKLHFRLGRRAGIYCSLFDSRSPELHRQVKDLEKSLDRDGIKPQDFVKKLLGRYI